ncbi:MAG: hypothetical protein DRQ56_04745 [Gammaproteobacteria bacterium]|nr:MAG: hypothetical protein DRQ56_04745 [Gammaproteobacteria bacterium]
MIQETNPLKVLLSEYLPTEGSSYGKRFHYELRSTIANARKGDEVAVTNLLHYFKESIELGVKVRGEVLEYLVEAIGALSSSESARLARALSVSVARPEVEDVLDKLPKITAKAEERLIKKMTASIGRSKMPDEEACERICMGSEVSMLYGEYSDKESLSYGEGKVKGIEPLDRAISEISIKRHKSREVTRRAYYSYQYFQRLGCVDSKGNFIIHDYEWLFPKGE